MPPAKPRKGQKKKEYCEKCRQVTTRRFDIPEGKDKPEWICLCCESAKNRSQAETRAIRAAHKDRKGSVYG